MFCVLRRATASLAFVWFAFPPQWQVPKPAVDNNYNYSFTTILPVFEPEKRPTKASASWTSHTYQRYVMLPTDIITIE